MRNGKSMLDISLRGEEVCCTKKYVFSGKTLLLCRVHSAPLFRLNSLSLTLCKCVSLLAITFLRTERKAIVVLVFDYLNSVHFIYVFVKILLFAQSVWMGWMWWERATRVACIACFWKIKCCKRSKNTFPANDVVTTKTLKF